MSLLPNVSHCLNVLEGILPSYQMLSLYQHYFPEEYKNSVAATTIELTPEQQAYLEYTWGLPPLTPKEAEFLGLIESRLFSLEPMYTGNDYEEHPVLPKPEKIPVYPFHYYLGEEDYYEVEDDNGVPFPVKLFQCVFDGLEHRCAIDFINQHFPDSGLIRLHINELKFDAACEKKGRKFALLPAFRRFALRSSENVFVDATFESPLDFPWSIEDMNFLIVKYKEAHELMSRFTRAESWLSKSPKACIQVIRLLIDSQKEE